MLRYAALVALLCAVESRAALVFDTDFAGPYQPAPNDPKLSGSLPPGWYDNSTWADVSLQYSKLTEDGRTFFRINVAKGLAQLSHPFPNVASTAFFRLTMTVRGPSALPFTVGIRQNGQPYNYYWQNTRVYPKTWQDITFWFQVGPISDCGVYLDAKGIGAFDIAAFRIEQFTYAEAAAVFHQGAPAGPKNLVRITRFPLGLQSGWNLAREVSDGDDATIGPDESHIGPSGSPALHIQSAGSIQLYSAPIGILDPSSPHVATFYATGTGSGAAVAISDGYETGRRNFTLNGSGWQRIQLSFTPALLGQVHSLRFDTTGEIWIDALQVELGTAATDYSSQAESEVSLSVDSPTHVVFDDETPVVHWSATGNIAGAKLKTRIVNVYGEQVVLPGVELSESYRQDGTLNFDVFPAHPLGAMRIEVWIEDTSGKPVSSFNELVVQRLRRPHYWAQDAPNSHFGSHLYSTNRHIQMAKAVGVNWVRLHDAGTEYGGWYYLENQRGQWQFHDTELQRYRTNAMKILGAFATAPHWASYFDRARNDYFDRYYLPRNIDDFANYVRVVAARYAPFIDTYDIWNEPWLSEYMAVGFDNSTQQYIHSSHPQADFALLTKTAYDNGRATVPGLRIVGFNTNAGDASTGVVSGPSWTNGIIAAGGLSSADVICYHQYPAGQNGFPGDEVATGFRNAIGPLLDGSGRPPKPVWLTEGSAVSTLIGPGFFNYTLPYKTTEDVFDTADRQTRFVTSLLAQGVEKVFLYSMATFVSIGMGNEWRALVGEDGYLHPSAVAMSALTYRLEDAHFVKMIAPAAGVTAYLFRGTEGSVAIVCPVAGHDSFTAPVANGVLVEDLFGNRVPAHQQLGSTSLIISSHLSVDALASMLTRGAGAIRILQPRPPARPKH